LCFASVGPSAYGWVMARPTKKQAKSADGETTPRRSPCPVAVTLDLLGDKWSLLVVRDLVLGAERFKEFASSPEGIPTNILADRLSRLQRHGVIEQVPAADGTRHPAYHLTEKGESLREVLGAIRDWGLKWEKGTRAMLRPRT
jgi:DNA-binding HxlR family transcriptional regulator